MKKRILTTVLCVCMLLGCACADEVTALSVGTMRRFAAKPNQKLALRMGPGTKYKELFTIPAANVDEFSICQKEVGGSTTWGMIDFYSGYGRYRAYTGMKRIDTEPKYIPSGNKNGVECKIGEAGADLYAGPGTDYVCYDDIAPAWLPITVYHEERGFVLADFTLPHEADEEDVKLVRAWIAVEEVFGYEAVTSPEEPASPIVIPGETPQMLQPADSLPVAPVSPAGTGGTVDVG